MDISRRQFLAGASAAALAAIFAPTAIYAQQAQQAPEQPLRTLMKREGRSPEMRFDIRNLRKEMGQPVGDGPFLPVIIRARKEINVPNWTYYEVVVDAGLLVPKKLTEAETVEQEKRLTAKQGSAVHLIRPVTMMRESVAFIGQMNVEVYMTPQQMQQHIEMYRKRTDISGIAAERDRWRDPVIKEVLNTDGVAGISDHLVKAHGFEPQPGEIDSILRCVIEAKQEALYVLKGLKPKLAYNVEQENNGPRLALAAE